MSVSIKNATATYERLSSGVFWGSADYEIDFSDTVLPDESPVTVRPGFKIVRANDTAQDVTNRAVALRNKIDNFVDTMAAVNGATAEKIAAMLEVWFQIEQEDIDNA
jgi:hypothetical protein